MAKRTSNEACCTCKFWRLAQEIPTGDTAIYVGPCRFMAPAIGWPIVQEGQYCGEYCPKDYVPDADMDMEHATH